MQFGNKYQADDYDVIVVGAGHVDVRRLLLPVGWATRPS